MMTYCENGYCCGGLFGLHSTYRNPKTLEGGLQIVQEDSCWEESHMANHWLTPHFSLRGGQEADPMQYQGSHWVPIYSRVKCVDGHWDEVPSCCCFREVLPLWRMNRNYHQKASQVKRVVPFHSERPSNVEFETDTVFSWWLWRKTNPIWWKGL